MQTPSTSLGDAQRWYQDVWLPSTDRSPKTVRAYVSDVNQFVVEIGPETGISAIRCESLEHWLIGLRRRGYETASIQRKLASVRLFFRSCLARGILSKSPFEGFRARLAVPRRLARIIGEDDLHRLLCDADKRVRSTKERNVSTEPMFELRDRAIIRLLAVTGIRVEEVASLTLERVSLETGVLQVQGKGNRERVAFLIDKADITPLTDYMRVRQAVLLAHTSVFINRRGGPLRTNGIRGILRKLAITSCAGRRVTPHMFRHTAATRLLENGADLRVVQEFLGHASIRSTERYTHVSRNHLRSVLVKCHPLKSLRGAKLGSVDYT